MADKGDLTLEHSIRKMDDYEYTNLERGLTIVRAGKIMNSSDKMHE
jgi:hypothetical protein